MKIAIIFIGALLLSGALFLLNGTFKEFPSLHGAILNGKLADVQYKLKRGSDVNAPDIHGITPLVYAIQSKRGKDVVQLLLSSGANPNGPTRDGSLPLEYAVLSHDKVVTELLMKAGGDPKKKYEGQRSPLELAEDIGDQEILSRIRQNSSQGN